jgi:D-psicose/D-tagatose/L-ribulose 3-epimerase
MDLAFTRRQVEAAGIEAVLSLGLDSASDISSDDPERVKVGKRRLDEVVADARDVGAKYVGGILYSAFQKYAEPPTEAGIIGAVEAIRRAVEKAATSGITLGMEVVNRYESSVLNTAAQAVEFCKLVGAPNVKVHRQPRRHELHRYQFLDRQFRSDFVRGLRVKSVPYLSASSLNFQK